MAEAVAWLELAVVLVGTAVGQVFYKLYIGQRRLAFLGLACAAFILGPVFTYLALKVLTIGQVYMTVAGTHVLVLLLSRLFLGEHGSRQQLMACAVVVAGVIVYSA
jgi:uncharacterized membrane protein